MLPDGSNPKEAVYVLPGQAHLPIEGNLTGLG